MAELSAAKRKAERVEGKMRKIRKLLERAEKQKLKILQVGYIYVHVYIYSVVAVVTTQLPW